MGIDFILWISNYYHYFIAKIVPDLATGALQAGSCVLSTCPHDFFSTSLISGTIKMFQAHRVFS